MRPKVKFLTVVWDKAYIARFAALALPSFLAPGNLPALADTTDLEVVIMTRSNDIGFFEQQATFQCLRNICAVRFVVIDDLITTGVYGVTLTLAYARPIIACGREMLDTHFVFMNADFVLADGSLRSLARHIHANRAIVLGPSFRATAEDIEPLLGATVNRASGVLSIAPRQMAALALRHPHATTIAKFVNQDLCHSTRANQFFWQVDQQTLLGRYYLIFMLCLKPERVIDTINSFCDYALIPELCPSGAETVMNDSDDFFMLELQSREQEDYLLRLGRQSDADIARSLQRWTTAEHRRAAHHDIVFHAGEIPAGLEAAKEQARTFIARIDGRLKAPVAHANHQFWIRGVEAWKSYRKLQGLLAAPPELGVQSAGWRLYDSAINLRTWLIKYSWFIAYTAQRTIKRHLVRLAMLSPNWLDLQLLQNTLAKLVRTPERRTLVIQDSTKLDDHPIVIPVAADFLTSSEILNGDIPDKPDTPAVYDQTLIYLLRRNTRYIRDIVEPCRALMKRGGDCYIFIYDKNGEMHGDDFATELLTLLNATFIPGLHLAECMFIGGRSKYFGQMLMRMLRNSYLRFGLPSLLWIAPLLTFVLPLSLITNIRLARKFPSRGAVDYGSSIMIHILVDPHPQSN